MTMVTSGKQGAFVAAMKQFGPVQTIRVPADPSPWPPFHRWFAEEQPNLPPLWQWARHFLASCTPDDCVAEQQLKHWRIDMTRANLVGANLGEVDLRGAYLLEAHLQGAHLQGAYLAGDLRLTKSLTQEQLNSACLDPFTRLPEHLSAPSERPKTCK